MNKFSLFFVSTVLATAPACADYSMQYRHVEDTRSAPASKLRADLLPSIGQHNLEASISPHAHDKTLHVEAAALSRIRDIQQDAFDAIKGCLPENRAGNPDWADLRQAFATLVAGGQLVAGSNEALALQTLSQTINAQVSANNEHLFPQGARDLRDGLHQAVPYTNNPAQPAPQGQWLQAVMDFSTAFQGNNETLPQALQHFMGAVRTHDDSIMFGTLKTALSQLQQGGGIQQQQQRNALNSLVTALAPVNAIQGALPQSLQDLWAALNTANQAGAPNWQGNQQQAFDDFANLIQTIDAIHNGQAQVLGDNDLEKLAQYSLLLSWYTEAVLANNQHSHYLVKELQNLFASVHLNYEQSKKVTIFAASIVDSVNQTPGHQNTLQTSVMNWNGPRGYSWGQNCRNWETLVARRFQYTEVNETSLNQHKALETLMPMVVSTALGTHVNFMNKSGFMALFETIKPLAGSTLSAVSVNGVAHILADMHN